MQLLLCSYICNDYLVNSNFLKLTKMKNNKTTDLIDALKEYNKTLADQIKRMKSFIAEIDKQISQHRRLDTKSSVEKVNTCFSRDYLLERIGKYPN